METALSWPATSDPVWLRREPLVGTSGSPPSPERHGSAHGHAAARRGEGIEPSKPGAARPAVLKAVP